MQVWQLRRKIHVSWLVAISSVAIVAGTALAPSIGQTAFSSLTWFFAACLLALVALRARLVVLIPFVIVSGLVFGLWRGSSVASQLAEYQGLYGRDVVVAGVASDDPESGRKGETQLRLSQVKINDRVYAGKVWASVAKGSGIKRGDMVTLEGKLQQGFGSFAANMYHADIVTVQRPQPGDVARQVRDWFSDNIRLAIDEPAASLGLGYLLGQKRELPTELQQALIVTGLTHVVVASGYNLTILVRLARRLFVKISKYLAALSATSMIVAFIAVTGASPSMSRAGLVAGLSLAAWYYGRKFHPLVLLPFAAAITVVVDPTYAWNDLGWQLSFAAFAGVMIMAPLLQRYFFGDKKPGTIRQILGETFSAYIFTLPILLLAFGQFSNVAMIANMLVLPLVPLAMLLTFVAGVGTVLLPVVAPVVGLPAEALLGYMITIVHYFAGLEWAQSTASITALLSVVTYVLLAAACVYLWRVTRYNLRDSNVVE